MPRSLAARFLLASLVLLPVLLGASAYMLDLAFRRSLESREAENLTTQVYLLLAAADFVGDSLFMPDAFQEPRFSQLNSGLYGWIASPTEAEVWRSPSARVLEFNTEALAARPIQPGATRFTTVASNQGPLFLLTYDIAWEIDADAERLFRVAVLHDQATINAEQESYRNQLWRWLGLLTLLLVATQGTVLRWGLRPLKSLARDLRRMESGQTTQLAGDYPKEIQPVTNNLNRVLDAERKQRERYRNTLDDLAHSLKTPLAVIHGSLEGEADDAQQIIREQVERMNQIVGHQLKRAVVNQGGMPGKPVAVEAVVKRLGDSLQKVYRDKRFTVDWQVPANCTFVGDERDLLELLGNLMENAFKYGRQHLHVGVKTQQGQLIIRVADDGPGIPEDQRRHLLNRGARADTATPGQGIGLAVAVDIVSSYGGSLEIHESELGGATFVVTIPQ